MILIFMVEGARELARERERERKRGPGQEGLKMGGPFMVEIVFCRVTRRGRKKKAGMNKLARENCRNDGPMGGGFIPPDTLKITLDLSDSGPVFSALDDMMMKMMEDDERARIGGRTQDNSAAKVALKKLLKSGIPGIEAMFGAEDPTPKFGKKGSSKKGFHKMTDASKKKFMNAIFGEEGTQIDSSTAAALLAATCSGGNADIGNKLAELLMPELDEKVDPAMMAALMAACSIIQTGANTEEVLNIMKLELAASGLTEEEILEKAKLLMRAFGKEEAGSTADFMLMSKQTNGALVQAGLPPKDFTSVRCSLEDVADNMISSLCARGEKTARIIGQVTETLKNTGATAHVVATTLMPPLVEMTGESEASLIRTISRNLKEVEYEPEDVKSAITELVLKILDNDMTQYVDAVKALEDSLKDMGMFANEIQEYIKANIPSPPTPPEEIERRAQMAAELARLEAEEVERERLKALKEADPGAYDKEMRAKLAEMKESDPTAYEAEMKKMGKSELDRLLSKSESRRGSLLPGQTRSRAGSIVIGTGSRRGSCLDTNRATVAMVTDDPEHKSAMREGLAGAFGDQECDTNGTNGYDDEEEETNEKSPAGSLPAGTKVEAGADGRVTVGGAKLPPGATVVNNPDGSKSISVTAEQEELVAKMLASGMDEATAYQYLQQLCGVAGKGKTLCNVGGAVSFRTAEESVENAKEILNAFDRAILKHKNRPKIEVPELTPEAKALMEQILASNGSKEEIASRVEALLAGSELSSSRGVNGGFDGNKKEHIPVSGPSRKAYIMLDESYEATLPHNKAGAAPRRQGSWREKEVQRRKNHNLGLAQHLGRRRQSWMSEAEELLRLQYRASLDRIMKMSIYDNKSSYDIQFMVNEFMFNSANLSEARSRRGGLPMDPMARPGQQGGSLADRIRARNAAKEGAEDGTGRGSVKRQSDIQREKKKSRQEEREEEKARKASYYRRVTGLRKAKGPMMVYSCGGFSRCFRVCRFYDVEGPPVGVEYEAPTPVTNTRNL